MKTRNFLALVLSLILSLLLVACDGATTPSTPATNSPLAVLNNTPTPATTTEAATSTPVIAPTNTALPANSVAPTETEAPTAEAVPSVVVANTATPVPATTRPVTTSAANSAKTTVPAATTPAKTNPPIPAATTAIPVIPTALPTIPAAPYTGPLSEVVRGRTGKKEVAITLDAGAGADPFPKLITGLSKAGVRITFFLTGAWAQQNPNFVQQIVNAGHEIANHTWSHPDLTKLTEAQIKDEIERTDAFLARFTGHTTRPIWRAPYGSRDARVMSVVNKLGYRSIYWTIDSLDSVGAPKTAKFLTDRITGQTDAQLDGEIILMHIGNATTADALPGILQNLQSRGFKIVTVSELIG